MTVKTFCEQNNIDCVNLCDGGDINPIDELSDDEVAMLNGIIAAVKFSKELTDV